MCKRFFLFAAYVHLFFLSSCSKGGEDFQENFSKIKASDRKVLDHFFTILIKQNEFGYTLFGIKPVSIASYFAPNEDNINNLSAHSILLEKGWNVWQKYAHLFPSKNFQLGRYEAKLKDSTICNIFILNKIDIRKSLEDNQGVFSLLDEYHNNEAEKWLQNAFTGAKLSQTALGTLLGYGTKNSQMFERRTETSLFYLNHPNIFAIDREKMSEESQEICFLHGKPAANDDLSILEPSKGFSTLVEEFNYINSQMNNFELEGTALGITSFGVPGFVCFAANQEETQELAQSYQATLRAMIKRYENHPFLETTLEQWTKG